VHRSSANTVGKGCTSNCSAFWQRQSKRHRYVGGAIIARSNSAENRAIIIVKLLSDKREFDSSTGFPAGLTVAQISEFSIVFIAMVISLGRIAAPALGLVTLVGLVTITLSTYMILYSYPQYARLAPWLGWAERKQPYREQAVGKQCVPG
jgi:predicted Kef-type K+ transport protein